MLTGNWISGRDDGDGVGDGYEYGLGLELRTALGLVEMGLGIWDGWAQA